MASSWPDGWISAMLGDADLPVTEFTKTVLQKWQESTPMLPYTNNPLGMPVIRGVTMELMRTGYAMFPTMPLFRGAFVRLIHSDAGRKVHDAIALTESYPKAWRAIHALPWPAASTETDWPVKLLDMTADKFKAQYAQFDNPADNKTTGTYGSQTAFGELRQDSSRHIAQAANTINQATRALPFAFRGVK